VQKLVRDLGIDALLGEVVAADVDVDIVPRGIGDVVNLKAAVSGVFGEPTGRRAGWRCRRLDSLPEHHILQVTTTHRARRRSVDDPLDFEAALMSLSVSTWCPRAMAVIQCGSGWREQNSDRGISLL